MERAPDILSPAFNTFKEEAPVTVPVRLAVIMEAVKLPDRSRATIALAVFAAVAVVAPFKTLPAVEIVPNLVSAILAEAETSLFTINEDDRLPDASLCTIPAVGVRLEIVITPPEPATNRDKPLVASATESAPGEKSPVFKSPVNE